MALDGVITGIVKCLGDNTDCSIDLQNDICRARTLCYILFNRYGVLNKDMAMVCHVPEGVMSEFRRPTTIKTLEPYIIKYAPSIIKNLNLCIFMANRRIDSLPE